MSNTQNQFNLEWWIIQKRFVYLFAFLVVVVAVAGGGYYFWNYGDALGANIASLPTGARFDSFEGDVRVIRAQTRETIEASSGLGLEPGDIVQTQESGRARILLIDGSTLLVRPNSVVQIRDNANMDGSGTRVRVAVDRGLVNVRTAALGSGQTNVVETKLTQNNIAAETGATFGVREDNTEDIRVASGSIETTTRDGAKTNVQGGEYVAVTASGRIARVEKLLEPPMPIAPRDLQRIFVTAGQNTANVTLRWQKHAGAMTYHVEVATSPFFVAAGRVSERGQLAASEFDVGALKPGAYYWRVQTSGASGQTSDWSEGQKFIVATPTTTQQQVELRDTSVEYVAGTIYILRGRAAPGNTVRAEGRHTLVSSNGFFQLQVTCPRGASAVNVEVEDAQGNRNRTRLTLRQS